MAHVAEKCGLGAIQFSEGLGALSLVFVRFRGGDAGGNLSRNQVKKPGVARVQLAIGIQRGNKHTRRRVLSLPRNGNQPRVRGVCIPPTLGPIGEQLRQVIHGDGAIRRQDPINGPRAVTRPGRHVLAGGRVTGFDSAMSHKFQPCAGFVEKVSQRERHILLVRQAAIDRPEDFFFCVGVHKRRGQSAQRSKLAFAQHAPRVFNYHTKHAGVLSVGPRQRTVGKRMVGFLRIPVPLQDQRKRLLPRSLSGIKHPVNPGSDLLPDFRPHFRDRPAQRPRMLLAQSGAGIAVVVENGQLRSPCHPHRKA